MSDPARGEGDGTEEPEATAQGGSDRTTEGSTDAGASERAEHEEQEAGEQPVAEDEDLEALRARVEEEYDFDDFGPADMAEMEVEEWEAAFDSDTWITGEELLDRVQADLEHRVATRDVFAVVERVRRDGRPCVLAYTDSGYALVEPDGSVEGFGTVLRDTKPVVALCSLESYDVPEPPAEDFLLPHPEEVPTESNELGNVMMQVVAGVHTLAGLVLFGAGLYLGAVAFLNAPAVALGARASGGAAAITMVVGIVFLVIGLALFATVANARLSDTFRVREYRGRLENMGLDGGERPEFLPPVEVDRERSERDAET